MRKKESSPTPVPDLLDTPDYNQLKHRDSSRIHFFLISSYSTFPRTRSGCRSIYTCKENCCCTGHDQCCRGYHIHTLFGTICICSLSNLCRSSTSNCLFGNLASNIAEFVVERLENSVSFSEEGKEDVADMFDLVEETYSTAIKSLKTKNKNMAKVAGQLEDDVDDLERKLKNKHIQRVKDGVCRSQADQVFIESLRNLERISDHADNIAYDVIMDT